MKGGDSGIENQVNFGELFMNICAVEHRTGKANVLFGGELYGAHCPSMLFCKLHRPNVSREKEFYQSLNHANYPQEIQE